MILRHLPNKGAELRLKPQFFIVLSLVCRFHDGIHSTFLLFSRVYASVCQTDHLIRPWKRGVATAT
jgi:hypothetical protein